MAAHPAIFLKGDHLSKKIKSGNSEIEVLRDINFSIQKGESVAILGTSGSGKTTLLTLLAGLETPTTGDIYFQHYHLNKLDEEARAQIRGKYIGFIFQSFHLLSTLTALENVMLPLELHHVKHSIAKQKALEWLKKVGLKDRISHYPSQLSGGEQQRVAIARAFVSEPTIIFADEMTGNLDTLTGDKIADILFDLNKQHKTTLVLVTHDDKLAQRCHIRLLLKEGSLTLC